MHVIRTDELVVMSHLRWDFVWQRPQHLISRLASADRRTWFVEEPRVVSDAWHVQLRTSTNGPVTQLWLEVPGHDEHCGFGDPRAEAYPELLADHLGEASARTVWLYTPMALPLADRLVPQLLVYDVMDDLASFAHAPETLKTRQEELFSRADLVFTGGRSLQRLVARTRPDAQCFPSGVEPEHYTPARTLQASRLQGDGRRPVAGYVGVIDERLDLDLLAQLADGLNDWDVEVVGPVLKIDPASLPTRPNLRYPGACSYDDLPSVLAGFDVAVMPFALNEATRSISPTKTLEYLAAGRPVVSTAVPDVVADFGEVVDIAENAAQFAAACRRLHTGLADAETRDRQRKIDRLLHWNHWDTIATRMAALLDDARGGIQRRGKSA